MFWGLIMEPKRRYTQKVKKAFHISMAAMDVSTSSDEPAQVICGFEGRNYLMCTLKKPDMLQCPLDLNFEVGSEVSFAANGKCHVHLTGYLTDDMFDDLEDEDEQEIEEEVTTKSKKRSKKSVENGPPSKKAKGVQVSSSQKRSEEESDSDSDLELNALLGKSLDDSDDEDETVVLEEEDDDDAEEEEDEVEEEADEEEGDSSFSEGASDEDIEVTKPQLNGVSKKKEQKQKEKKVNQPEQVKKAKSEQKKEKTPSKENQTPKKKTIAGGIIVEDIREGQGAPAKNGKFVTVFYEGRLKQNNKLFDSTSKGAGFSFRLGNGEVIKGWDIGVAGMKPGGKRRITCPPAMAYGQKGSPPAIPPNSTLVFEVELKKIS